MRRSEEKGGFLFSVLLLPLYPEKVTSVTVLYAFDFLYVGANVI